VLSLDEVKRNMWRDRPDSEEGLAALYIFDGEGVKSVKNGDLETTVAVDRSGAFWRQMGVSRGFRAGV
jgi:hypothetical protein